MGEQGLPCVRRDYTFTLRSAAGRKENVSREEMSENETRDGATACELAVHIQVEKTENPGAACVFLLWFF